MATSAQITGTWILLAIYVIAVLYLVFKGAGKTKSISDYAIGSVLFFAGSSGIISSCQHDKCSDFCNKSSFIANFGVSGVLSYAVFLPLASMISLVVLTKSFRKHGQTVKALTLAQWIGKRYDSKRYAFFMGILALLLLTFIVLLVVALTKVLAQALNLNEVNVMIVIVLFVFGYMMFGGANSMVYTNAIQAAVMLIVAVILLTSGYEHFSHGVHGFLDKLAAIDSACRAHKPPPKSAIPQLF